MRKIIEDFLSESANLIHISESIDIGTESYQKKLDELIEDLMTVKNSVNKKNRKFYRKEASRLQNAIVSLRYIRNKSARLLMQSQAEEAKVLIPESVLVGILAKEPDLVESDVFDSFGRVAKGSIILASLEAAATLFFFLIFLDMLPID